MESENWGRPDQTGAALDFRSDVITTPSKGMLAAIAGATLQDDVYGEDATTSTFEREVAELCGHEAAAFVLTGTMANQLAIRCLLDARGGPPHGILADDRAHILHFEAGGVAHLSGAMVRGVRPLNGRHLTAEDLEARAVPDDGDVHRCPTRVVSVENTAAGSVVPLAEMRRLKVWTAGRGVALHVDGARLWEAVAAVASASDHAGGEGVVRGGGEGGGGGGRLPSPTIQDFAQCCDALSLDFSKNLGAPMGAMVVGSSALIRRVKHFRKSLGGGMRQAGVLSAAARRAVLENFCGGSSINGDRIDVAGVFRRSHDLARRIGEMWTRRGGRLLGEVETNMVWVDLRSAGVRPEAWNEIGRRHGVRLDGKRLVVHHQVCEEAVRRLGNVMDDVLGVDACEGLKGNCQGEGTSKGRLAVARL